MRTGSNASLLLRREQPWPLSPRAALSTSSLTVCSDPERNEGLAGLAFVARMKEWMLVRRGFIMRNGDGSRAVG